MKFSEKLQKLRKENKLSQEQLADMLEVSRQAVSKWESGQTYPEMDKLIALSKIFKCSLDDLTNDEVTDTVLTNKAKSSTQGFIDEILEIIDKSFVLFKRMNAKQIAKCIIMMWVIIFIIMFFHIPVEYLYDLGVNIFKNFGSFASGILSSIWRFILEITYLILGIFLFMYTYKTRYLDKIDDYPSSNGEKEELTVEDGEIKLDKKTRSNVEVTNEYKNESMKKIRKSDNGFNKTFSILGNIFMFFVKGVALFTLMPFLMCLFALFIIIVLWFGLLFKGIILFGVLLIIISVIVLNTIIIEIIYNFIVSRKLDIKRIFIMLIVSIAVLGAGFGITMIDVTRFDFINKVPENVEQVNITKELLMRDSLVITSHLNNDIEYIVDDTLENKIVIEVYYYKDFSDSAIYEMSPDKIDIGRYYINNNINSQFKKFIINDLKNGTIHNYEKLYELSIKVYAANSNVEKLKKNNYEYMDALFEREMQETINDYEDQIFYLNETIYKLEMEIEELNNNDDCEERIQVYKEEIENYKDKIKEYKDKIGELLTD